MRKSVVVERFSLYETPVGWGGVTASRKGIAEVFLPFGGIGRGKLLARLSMRWPMASEGGEDAAKASDRLSAYFMGCQVDFDMPLDSSRFTQFQMKVYDYVRSIPCGEIRTYGEVAKEIGKPTAARGVGAAMAANPLPIIIPCHRVVGVSGNLTGYSAEGGIDSKRWLLRLEGVEISGQRCSWLK